MVYFSDNSVCYRAYCLFSPITSLNSLQKTPRYDMTLSIHECERKHWLIIFTDLSRATNWSCISSWILTIKLSILPVYFILRQIFAMGENANIILAVTSSFVMVSFANDRKQRWTQEVSFIIFRKFQNDLLNFTLQFREKSRSLETERYISA